MRRPRHPSLRRGLYTLARLMGDANAISRGPSAIGKRMIRKYAYRSLSRFLNRILR